MADPRALLTRLEASGVRLGLDHVRAVLAELGDPHRAVPAVLVAGTNGKGSTAAHLAAILSASGFATGLYTSPHLEAVEERVRVDGAAIATDELGDLLQQVVDAAAGAGLEPPTYFEALTAVAMMHFAQRGLDLAVYEVGMGGRLDATNVVDPVLSLVTEISLDHQEMLGDTLDMIAREKAGVLREGVPCCHWISDPVARREVEKAAQALGAPSFDVRLIAPEIAGASPDQDFHIRGLRLTARAPALGGGWTRARNLTLALTAAEVLSHAWPDEAGFRLTTETAERAFRSCRWPGRWELVERPGGGQVLLDGAHNLQGAESLAESLADQRYGLVFGALADKPIDRMLDILARGADWLVLTRPANRRAAEPEEVAQRVEHQVTVKADPADALRTALKLTQPDQLLVVCGSLYLVGEVRGLLRQRWGRPGSTERIYQVGVGSDG